MPSSRMHRGLVALSASAVAAIYMAGYVRTQSADARIGASAAALCPGVTSSAVIATTPPVGATPMAIPPTVQRQVPVTARALPTVQPTTPPVPRAALQPTAPPALIAPQAAPGTLKDGTCTG